MQSIMKYLLRIGTLDGFPEIEITANEYVAFERARNILNNALEIEEKYEILITNYLDFEKQILDSSAGDMVRMNIDYSDFFEVRLGLNIRLVNLLTAARLYIDQLNQNVRECALNITNPEQQVKNFMAREYDTCKEYRFMEALRNYVQHRGIPVHFTKQGGRWTSKGDNGFIELNMELYSQRTYLKEDLKFKKEVLEELDEFIDLKAATRRYIESISNVHESVRGIIKESVSEARKLIEDAHERYSPHHSGSMVGLIACKWSDQGQESAIPLLLDWDDIRLKLQKRNRKLTNLRKHYVSSSIKIHTM